MIPNIQNQSLFIENAYINGQWVTTENTFYVHNPATGNIIAHIPNMDKEATQQAIEVAHIAFQSWKNTSAQERANLLKKWHQLMLANANDLARILTTEQGKPLTEALGEINYGASYIEWFAEEARRTYGDVIPGHQADKRIVVIKQPVGVVGIITPWNFPNAMLARKIAPALAAGCTVVIKPSELTPLSALAMVKLAEEAGIPAGVINVITTTHAPEVGMALCQSPLVRKISFTGSTPVGKWLMKNSSDTLKKLSLELGGNAPFIVFDDADITEAVKGAIIAKYRNAGQTCVCANRIFVQDKVYDQFIEQFSKAVNVLQVGNGLDTGIEIGPLIDDRAIAKVNRLIGDALSKGATIAQGGKQHLLGKTFFEPTVLANVTPQMDITNEEIFGPVAPVYRFTTEQEAVALANDTPFGLAAYFYGQNMSRIWRVAEALEYGMVGINTGLISTAVAPFGGIKESGFGREGSKYGIGDYMEIKYLCMSV
jgi:succinate-semialdehyde dehydrogenase / glutarate-semialdehyde dehydrogenase